jgi:hypothetical protein
MHQPEALERWVSWNLRNYAEHGFGLYALELLESDQFIGDAGVTYQIVEGERIHEIGWHIHADHRGRSAVVVDISPQLSSFNRLENQVSNRPRRRVESKSKSNSRSKPRLAPARCASGVKARGSPPTACA